MIFSRILPWDTWRIPANHKQASKIDGDGWMRCELEVAPGRTLHSFIDAHDLCTMATSHEHRAPTDDYYTIDLRTHSHFDTCPSFEIANNIDISSTATGEGRSTKIIMDIKRRRRTSSSSSCRRRRSAGITTHTNLFLRLVRITTAAAMAILVLVTTTTTTTTITTTSMTSSLPVRLLLLSPSFFVMAQTYAPTTSHAPSISHAPNVPTTSPTLLGTDEGTTLQPTPAGEGTMAPATTTDAPSTGTPSSAIPVPVVTVSLVLF